MLEQLSLTVKVMISAKEKCSDLHPKTLNPKERPKPMGLQILRPS